MDLRVAALFAILLQALLGTHPTAVAADGFDTTSICCCVCDPQPSCCDQPGDPSNNNNDTPPTDQPCCCCVCVLACQWHDDDPEPLLDPNHPNHLAAALFPASRSYPQPATTRHRSFHNTWPPPPSATAHRALLCCWTT